MTILENHIAKNYEKDLNTARTYSRSMDDAKDAVQEAYIKAIDIDLSKITYISSYISRMIINQANNIRRYFGIRDHNLSSEEENMVIHKIPSNQPNPEEQTISKEIIKTIFHEINDLKSPYNVILFRFLSGEKKEKIACSLDLPIHKVESSIQYSRKLLRLALSNKDFAQGHKTPTRKGQI